MDESKKDFISRHIIENITNHVNQYIENVSEKESLDFNYILVLNSKKFKIAPNTHLSFIIASNLPQTLALELLGHITEVCNAANEPDNDTIH